MGSENIYLDQKSGNCTLPPFFRSSSTIMMTGFVPKIQFLRIYRLRPNAMISPAKLSRRPSPGAA
jgi:hypothetical protein